MWCKSNFSFLHGASHPWELIARAHEQQLAAIALTDRDAVYGVVRAHVATRDHDIPLLIGSELHVEDHPPIVALAMNLHGYRNLTRLITRGRRRCEKGASRLTLDDFADSDHLIALCNTVTPTLVELFGDRLYALAARHRVDAERPLEAALRAQAKLLDVPIVAANEVLYHDRARRPLQDVLTCIRHNTTLFDAGTKLRPNAGHALHAPADFATLFADQPAWVERTLEVAARCDFSLSQLRYVYPSERLPDGSTTGERLEQLVWAGAARRYPAGVPDDVRAQLLRELSVIADLDYAGYFLTMHEIVEYCQAHDILCQGRGSAANSAVCFCLGITAVDPVRLGLLFERFISRERAEPPDIDLDIMHSRREEVIQHVYQKHGRDHAAMVANFVRFRAKSAIREVGKTLGIPETALDRVAKMASPYGAAVEAEPLDNPRPEGTRAMAKGLSRHLFDLANELLDFPRHLSIHPGGFILGSQPVYDLVPIENASMPDRTVIQWDKYDVEDLGLFKVDLLALGALTQLHQGFVLIEAHRNVQLDMASIPHEDRDTYDMICEAKTIGTFQIESRAQMSMLPRLRPRTFYDLVIQLGIVRPGPIAGDMVHPYLRRRDGTDAVTYPHPLLEPILKKTLGIPLFQEQVMKLAIVAASYTPGEADQLRRDMGAWRSHGKIEQHRERLISRMRANGIEQQFAERIFAQIQGFGEYGFPESHSASFALITYATCYMKQHFPVEFTCSLLNAQPMGFYAPATIVDDAKREGVIIHPIDVSVSSWDCTLERYDGPVASERAADWAIRIGLRYIRGLPRRAAQRILEARDRAPFASIRDLVVRTQVENHTLRLLAEAGALDCFGMSRRHALWTVQEFSAGTLPLPFETEPDDVTFSELTPFEAISWDYRTSFHSARGHPMQSIRAELAAAGLCDSEQLRAAPHNSWADFAGMVICRQRPMNAHGVLFMTLEDELGLANVVIWAKTFEKYRMLAKTQTFLGVSGRLQSQHNVVHLVAERLWIPRVTRAPPRRASHDFQ